MKVKITTQENMKYYGCEKNTVVEVDLEDYVTCVVAGEIGNAKLEACKAQAVAARTFSIARGVLDGKVISDSASVAQAYRANRINYKACHIAAEATVGQILEYNGKPISAVYCHSNGGRIRSGLEVWGTDTPYLQAKNDAWDKETKQGHGVGMSQAGAINMAIWGKSYKEILEYYYPGTKLTWNKKAVFARIRSIINKIMARL